MPHTEAGRVIVGAVLVAISLTAAITYASNLYTQSEVLKAAPLDNAIDKSVARAAVQNQQHSKDYQVNCAEKGDADLCTQRRMAKAADKQIRFSRYGLWLLIATTIFTGIAAVAAWKTFRVSKITAEKQLRAYVALEGGAIEIVNIDGTGVGLKIHLSLKNYGQTPAYDFTTWMKKPVVEDSGSLPFTPAIPISERNGASIIGPGSQANIEWVIATDAPTIDELRAGTKRVFVWGGADFRDTFGEPRYIIVRCVNGSIATPTAWALGPHKIGYEASEHPKFKT